MHINWKELQSKPSPLQTIIVLGTDPYIVRGLQKGFPELFLDELGEGDIWSQKQLAAVMDEFLVENDMFEHEWLHHRLDLPLFFISRSNSDVKHIIIDPHTYKEIHDDYCHEERPANYEDWTLTNRMIVDLGNREHSREFHVLFIDVLDHFIIAVPKECIYFPDQHTVH